LALRPAFPGSTAGRHFRDYYGGSAPPAPSAGIAPIPGHHPGWAAPVERARAVPTFTAVRSTGQAPGSTPAASPRLLPQPIHRGLPSQAL